VHRFFIVWGCGWMIVVLVGLLTEWKGSRLTGRPFKMRVRDVLIACITWPLQLLIMGLAVTLLWGKRGKPKDDSN
jgi:hypothetical protein